MRLGFQLQLSGKQFVSHVRSPEFKPQHLRNNQVGHLAASSVLPVLPPVYQTNTDYQRERPEEGEIRRVGMSTEGLKGAASRTLQVSVQADATEVHHTRVAMFVGSTQASHPPQVLSQHGSFPAASPVTVSSLLLTSLGC